jgi:hypothetical protein
MKKHYENTYVNVMPMDNTSDLDELLAKWKVSTPVDGFLPIEFDDGVTVTEFKFRCSYCDKHVDNANVRGTTLQSENIVYLVVTSICNHCTGVTGFKRLLKAFPGKIISYNKDND